MKFKITRPDGTIIEGEGTGDDVQKLAPALPSFVLQPVRYHFDWYPAQPSFTPRSPGGGPYEFTC